jgi:hypothetical protein
VDKRVIYNNADGQLAVLVPAPDCGLTIEEIALKDVPYGLPFKIVGLADLPADRTQRNAWTVDNKDLTDGVGADYGVGSDNPFVMPESAL